MPARLPTKSAGIYKRSTMINIQKEFDFVKDPDYKTNVDLYLARVPFNPLCADEKGPLSTLPKHLALQKKYIQHNPPLSMGTFIIDYDDSESHYKWDDLHAPPPQFAVMNKINGHCHLVYIINNKVYKNKNENLRPYKLLCHVENALIKKLNADRGYTNLISKNLLHDSWVVYGLQQYTYDLNDFFDYLPIEKDYFSKDSVFNFGLGRNCTIFENLRHRAYSLIRDTTVNVSLDFFIDSLFSIALNMNSLSFAVPLPKKEVFTIAKSVGKWTYSHFSLTDFIAIQSRRGKKSGKVRAEKASELYREIKQVKIDQPNLSNRKIATMLNVSETTVRRALLYIEPSSDDEELFRDQPDLFSV